MNGNDLKLLTSIAAASSLLLPISSLGLNVDMNHAFADGVAQETVQGVVSPGRLVDLVVIMNPPVITNQSGQFRSLQFQLQDANSNAVITHTTYEISITKVNNGSTGSNILLLHDNFHSHTGTLLLKAGQPSNSTQNEQGHITVVGIKDPSFIAWVADSNGTVYLQGPFLSDSGLYHLQVSVLGIDNDTSRLEQPIRFDSWLSLGSAFTSKLDYNNKIFNITIISYYDKVIDYKFDAENKVISWSTPFYWNLTQISVGNVLAHEEIIVPKSLMETSSMSSFSGSVNGRILNSAGIIMDTYSYPNSTVIHYVVSKETLLKLAQNNSTLMNPEGENGSSSLSFTLSLDKPLQQNNFYSVGQETSNRRADVWIGYTPSQLVGDQQTNLSLKFYGYVRGQQVPLEGDVSYNIKVLESNGVELIAMNNLVAKNAADDLRLPISSDKDFNVVVNITGVRQQSGDVVGVYNGVVMATVTVPEFPISATQAFEISLAMFVMLIMLNGKKLRF